MSICAIIRLVTGNSENFKVFAIQEIGLNLIFFSFIELLGCGSEEAHVWLRINSFQRINNFFADN